MGGDDQNKPKPAGSIEDWLASRLGGVDDDPVDSEEVSFTEAADAGAEVDLELPEPDPDEPITETPPGSATPRQPEPPAQPPASLPGMTPRGPAPQPLGQGGPITTEDPNLWSKDGDTQPLPPAPDPYASRSTQGAPATVDFDAQRNVQTPPAARRLPPVEDVDEPTLPHGKLLEKLEARMPGNTFDEVFPQPDRPGEGQENTAALLAGVDRPPPRRSDTPPLELMEIEDEAAPNNIHTEATAVSIPPPGFLDFADDDQVTVISAPPARGPIRPARPRPGDPDEDDVYPASVLAWTASTLGVLIFGALFVVCLIAVAQYFDVLQLEMLDLDLLPGMDRSS